jgi:deazaflavin-dependent oxidoreductase (nitroreductase family)
MAYIKPPAFTQKVFNPLAMRFGISGSNMLSVRGRRSGEPRRVPVIPVEQGGARYLVSPRGETEWVRNLRAAGGHAELGKTGALQQIQATEVPADESGPILAAYQRKAGRMVAAFFAKLPDPADHPVFRVTPR